MLQLLNLVTLGLECDAPVVVSVAELATMSGMAVEMVRGMLDWLVDRRYLVLDDAVDGRMRLWVNPSVAFAGGSDPRPAAARYEFPYITCHEGGTAADEPVRHLPYDAACWEYICQENRGQFFADPPMFPFGCPAHGDLLPDAHQEPEPLR